MRIAEDRFPLRLERRCRGNLAGQIADLLRGALATGFYKPGDVLPTIRELAGKLEVGRVNVERAVARLTDEGFLNPRPGIGCVVCGADVTLWKGRVLIVVPSGAGNMADIPMATVIRDYLTVRGYLAHVVTVSRKTNGKFDFALLDLMSRQHCDLVVQLHDKPEISRWLSGKKLPYVRCAADLPKKLPPSCVGLVRRSHAAATSAFVEHCRAEGIRQVLVVRAWGANVLERALRKAGISVHTWRIEVPAGATGVQVAQHALDSMTEWLGNRSGRKMPELMFLYDDYLASGALTAMLYAGVRIPRDVKVVTIVNPIGSGLVFPFPLTHFRANPLDWGRILAEWVFDYLKTGRFSSDAVVGSEYVVGDTFPCMSRVRQRRS